MAIKVNGTEVIDDSRGLLNVTDATGKFGEFYPSPATITTNINFTTPFMTVTLSGATTFTSSGTTASGGKSAILCLDTSSTGHTPTFPSSFNWEDDTDPTWSSYRKWQIHMIHHSVGRIDATAIGFDAQSSQPTEAVALSGTTGTPITFTDFPGSNNNDLVMGWEFASDGNIYKYESVYNIGGQGRYLHSSTQWNNITPSQTYYIRVTNFGGTKNISTSDSDTLNSWIALTSNREFQVRDSRDITTYADENCVIKVEISSNSGGSTILDTGYYEMRYIGNA
jgi:hypothetical protein